MTVEEWSERLVRPEHIAGLVIDVGSDVVAAKPSTRSTSTAQATS